MEIDHAPVILTHYKEIRSWLDFNYVSLGVSQILKPWDYNLYNAYPITNQLFDKNKDLSILKPTGPKLLVETSERMMRESKEWAIKRKAEKDIESKRQDEEYSRHIQKLRDKGWIP